MNPIELRRVVRRLQLRTQRALGGPLAGLADAVHRGRGLDFEEVRLYQPGDDVRDIDWKASARSSRIFLKRYSDERQITVWLLVDVSPGFLRFGEISCLPLAESDLPVWSKRRFVLELSTLLAMSAALRLDRVGLCTFGAGEQFLAPSSGERRAWRLAQQLAACVVPTDEPAVVNGKGASLKRAVDSLTSSGKGPSLVLGVGEFSDADDAAVLGKLRRRSEVRALRVLHPWERQLPHIGLARFLDNSGGRTCVLDTNCPRTRAHYATAASRRSAEIRHAFQRRRIQVVEMTTDSSAAHWMLRYARR
jgi:uncharacterized protein (DUF58 family)